MQKKKSIKIIASVAHDLEHYKNNKLFSKYLPSHSFLDKDNRKEIFLRADHNVSLVKLKEALENSNFDIFTKDLKENFKNIDFEFHFYGNLKKEINGISYCILPEIKEVDKMCSKEILKKKYNKIFTNLDDDVDNKQFFKVNSPQSNLNLKTGSKRQNLACIISSNKNLNVYSKDSGYKRRAEIIKWFTTYYPDDLHVYGKGWDTYFFSNYFINRLTLYIQRKLNIKKRTNFNFKGTIINKIEVLKNYKFNFCIENHIGKNGYFTGILFDSFNSGTIPIYAGCKNIDKYIPKNCYIDFNSFSNFKDLRNYLKSITEKDFKSYQNNIIKFLKSDKMKEFEPEKFIETIIYHLNKDKKHNGN